MLWCSFDDKIYIKKKVRKKKRLPRGTAQNKNFFLSEKQHSSWRETIRREANSNSELSPILVSEKLFNPFSKAEKN